MSPLMGGKAIGGGHPLTSLGALAHLHHLSNSPPDQSVPEGRVLYLYAG